MQKKILLIGNGEGSKRVVQQNLLDVPIKPLTSGISLEMVGLNSKVARYSFWCVDSYELDATHDPVHYYQNCAHVLIIPKNHQDLLLISSRVKPYTANQVITVLLPSLNIINPMYNYFNESFAFVLSKITEKNHKIGQEARGEFVEKLLKHASDVANTKPIIHTLNLFFRRSGLVKDVRNKLITEYIIPTILSTRI